MPYVKTLRGRGANGVVVATGEVLFAPGAVVPRWASKFTAAVKKGTAAAAPTNKRPRWAHYGTPLKKSFRGTTNADPSRMMVHAAVGSTARHAWYVDQGTSDFDAKILPPWRRGGPSLYEHTWKPGGRGKPVGPIHVRGQKGQHFFERGLDSGFAAMRLVAGGPVDNLKAAVAKTDHALPNFLGNTQWSVAFQFQLEEWRRWRDMSFKAGESLSNGGKKFGARERQLTKHAGAVGLSKEIKKAKPARSVAEPGRPKVSRSTDRKAFMAAMIKKYGRVDENPEYRNGRWYVSVWKKELNDGRGGWDEVSAKAKS